MQLNYPSDLENRCSYILSHQKEYTRSKPKILNENIENVISLH